MTIPELKKQKRWLLWRLEPGKDGKPTKVPYRPNGYKASLLDATHLHTYADLEPHAAKFSGIGLALGEFDGVAVWGVDIDNCCDAVTGKFSPESRQVVIDLDSYAEYSPSGTGCHIWGIGKLFGKGLQKPYPGCKQIEVKGLGYYQTFTGRHLSKTPATLEDRQEQITALYNRVAAMEKPKVPSLTMGIPLSEEERFQKLWAGDISAYRDDHSAADFALCILLAKKHNCNAFKVDAEFRKSGLYREKWERDDYRENTITRAIAAVLKETPVIFDDPKDEPIEDDSETEYVVEALSDAHEGWFPLGELSLIGGSSGSGKTYWMVTLLGKVHKGADVWGHKAKARDYRVLLHDRSTKAMLRTVKALGLSAEARERIVRLSSSQQTRKPAEILEPLLDANPNVEIWFIEGLDLWIPKQNDMSEVAPILDGLQRLATRRNIAIVASMGAPKQKPKDRYYGRDALFGSSAFARKVETVVTITLSDADDGGSARRYTVFPRNGKVEEIYMGWSDKGLVIVEKPAEQKDNSAVARVGMRVLASLKPGDKVVYSPEFGAETTFGRWRKQAVTDGIVVHNRGDYFLARLLDVQIN